MEGSPVRLPPMPELALEDRFTTRAGPDGGWEVIDLGTGRGKRVLASCPDRQAALAIAWFFRGDFECGTRLLLDTLAENSQA